MRTRIILSLVAAALLAAAGLTSFLLITRPGERHPGPSAQPAIPAAYTGENGADAWRHPSRHMGAHVDLTGTVAGSTRARQGVVVALRVPGADVAVHVFDRHFRVRAGHRLHVIGAVRGALGGKAVPGVKAFPPLSAGATVIDARAASRG